MKKLQVFAEALEKYVTPTTHPVAVKLLKLQREIPENARRPKRDFGQTIMPCQGVALARREGLCIAMLSEDYALDCGLGLIVFGIVEPPKWWLEGNLNYKTTTESRKAAMNFVKNISCFEHGEFLGVMFSPIKNAVFEPDMVMIYCNSVQAMYLVQAAIYETGYPLTSRITASAVCSASIVQTVQTGKCQLSIPCGGDRFRAFAKDDEIVFSAPFNALDGLVKGLKTIAEVKTPSDPIMRVHFGIKSPLSKRYEKLKESIEQQI